MVPVHEAGGGSLYSTAQEKASSPGLSLYGLLARVEWESQVGLLWCICAHACVLTSDGGGTPLISNPPLFPWKDGFWHLFLPT